MAKVDDYIVTNQELRTHYGEILKENFGNAFRTWRDSIDLNDRQIARDSGLSSTSLGQWYRGVSLPDTLGLFMLAAYSGEPVDYFLGKIPPTIRH